MHVLAGVVITLACLVFSSACKGEPPAHELFLGVAASLRQVMPELVRDYEKTHPAVQIRATYGASGDLQRQVEGGAPLDGVLFASSQPVDALLSKGLARPETRRVIATNTLVLIGPVGGPPIKLATLKDLPAGERLALGEPGAVPAGQYAKEALVRLGMWEALQGRLVFGGDVAAVLAYARRGEVVAAFVYRSELRGVGDVVELDEVAPSLMSRVEVVAAAVRGAKSSKETAEFLEFLSTPAAQQKLREFGFGGI
ncbi:uncharacterized protein CMC5_032180 [Chondromyces crocatus]|uniref:Molybdate ABC transporter substrate-binding protein n=1 Tax=Chondromyces crocatus TaxID=52 RepID=A0A0K1EDY3_CHOCO|nr:uncharacterized protein CMC5_032180 [Chondromyces crocatus]